MTRRHFFLLASAAAAAQPQFVTITDSSGALEATAAPSAGGELASLRVRHRGQWIELLHRARDYSPTKAWQGRAPLLWPATGRNFAASLKPVEDLAAVGGYDLDGKRYPMPLHGFARQMPWQVVRSGGQSLLLSLTDNDATRRYYPFSFRLTVEYALRPGVLDVLYSVRAGASNKTPMPFSIGNHITFRVPFVAGTDPTQMTLFSPATVEYLKTPEGLPTGQSRPIDMRKSLRLSEFNATTARSLGGYRGVPFAELTDPGGLAVRLENRPESWPSEPFIQFNMWGDPRAGYFSPEPWAGLQNSLVLNQGLVRLAPGKTWHWNIRMEVK